MSYAQIFYTRDITHGLGQRDLAYSMITDLYEQSPESAIEALRLCVYKYGSWCDIKYFCRYVRLYNRDERLIDAAIDIIVQQLDVDNLIWTSEMDAHLANRRTTPRPIGREILSYAAKWVPREKSAMGWLFDRIVERWGPVAHYNTRYRREFRKMVSMLNRELDTVEIKQCAGRLQDVLYENIPINALIKQHRTFSKLDVYPKSGSGNIGQKTPMDLAAIVKIALTSNGQYNDMLNRIWSKNCVDYSCGEIVPVIDSINNYAIGLGIIIAQNSSHGRLILLGYSVYMNIRDSFTTIISRIKPLLLNPVVDSGITTERVIVLSENYYTSMHMLSYFAKGGTSSDEYMTSVLNSERYS